VVALKTTGEIVPRRRHHRILSLQRFDLLVIGSLGSIVSLAFGMNWGFIMSRVAVEGICGRMEYNYRSNGVSYLLRRICAAVFRNLKPSL